jgi:hypothetical protein
MKRAASKPKTDTDVLLVAQIAAAISIGAFLYFLRQDQLTLFGDAVAHMNIARRVIDSRTPGLLQLGTVWLPLPHLLMLPFLASRYLWQTGMAGSFPSMLAYVFSTVGIFRLVRTVLPDATLTSTRTAVRFTAWLAAAGFALNPNVVYMQATAMTEPVYLAFFIWTLAFFAQALKLCRSGDHVRANKALLWTALCLAAGSLTRYDGWFLTAVVVAVAAVLSFVGNFAQLRPGVIKLVILAAIGPGLWLGYNAAVYGNPLEFANGPYSAKAIEQKTSVPGFPPHPGSDDLKTSFHYFFKAAELNLAASGVFDRNQTFATRILQMLWVAALLLGTTIVALFQPKLWPVLLLWIPVPFYMLSIAHSGVPIFVPVWWPFSYYNVRYGVEFIPAFAVLAAMAAYGLIRFAATVRTAAIMGACFLALVFTTYAHALKTGVVSYQEAVINARTRVALEKQLASIFETMPQNSTFLMYLGDHPGALQRAGIPLSHVINEGNHRPWKRPTDPDGLWEKALAHPASYVDYVIALDSDDVAKNVNKDEIDSMLVLHVTGQPPATIYKTRKSNQPR